MRESSIRDAMKIHLERPAATRTRQKDIRPRLSQANLFFDYGFSARALIRQRNLLNTEGKDLLMVQLLRWPDPDATL